MTKEAYNLVAPMDLDLNGSHNFQDFSIVRNSQIQNPVNFNKILSDNIGLSRLLMLNCSSRTLVMSTEH